MVPNIKMNLEIDIQKLEILTNGHRVAADTSTTIGTTFAITMTVHVVRAVINTQPSLITK